jgi:peptidylprolyl isomerase
MPPMRKGSLIIFALLAVLVAGCGGGSESTTSREEKPAEEKPSQGKPGGDELSKAEVSKIKKPKVTVPQGPPPENLVVKDLKMGKGPPAEASDEVTITYLGVYYKTGKAFGSSWNGAGPYTFNLGTREVISGWNKGVEGMRVGGRRKLIIPPKLVFGSREVDGTPPNSTLVFVIDLIAIK